MLAVNEAVSNSVEHAYLPPTPGDTVELTFWSEADVVCLEIVDHGAWRVPLGQIHRVGAAGSRSWSGSWPPSMIHYDAAGRGYFCVTPCQEAPSPRSTSQGAAPDRSRGGVGSKVTGNFGARSGPCRAPRRRKRLTG